MFDLKSSVRRQLLVYYFTNPTARLHVRDLAERLDLDHSNLSKELRRLESEGLFRSEVSGRQKYFQLNPASPLVNWLKSSVSTSMDESPDFELVRSAHRRHCDE